MLKHISFNLVRTFMSKLVQTCTNLYKLVQTCTNLFKLFFLRFLFIIGLIELCWNTYPSTWWSSALLHGCHIVMLVSIFMYMHRILKISEQLKKKVQEKASWYKFRRSRRLPMIRYLKSKYRLAKGQ